MSEEIESTEVEEQAPESQEAQEENNHGHMSLDAYLEQGGDPDMYRGRKAFDQYHDQLQELTKFKRSNKDLTNSVTSVLAQQKEFINSQNEVVREQNAVKISELEEQLTEAHVELDSKKAVSLQRKIDKLEAKTVEPKQPQGTAPQSHFEELEEYQEDNPELDKNAAEFNPALHAVVTNVFDNQYNAGMTDRQVRRLLKKAHNHVLDMPEFKAKQPKRAPKTASPGKKPPSINGAAKVAKLDASSKQMYDFLAESNGKAAAEDFLKNIEV